MAGKLGFLALGFYFVSVVLRAASGIIILFFAGVLGAVILNGLSRVLTRRGLSYRVSLGLVILLGLACLVGLSFSVGSAITDQSQQLSKDLPDYLTRAKATMADLPFGDRILSEISNPGTVKQLSSRLLGWSSTLVGAFSSGLLLAMASLYLAAEPDLYWGGIQRLAPPRHRDRVRGVGERIRRKLWAFVKGQFFSMSVLAVLTGAGLWFLDVRLYLLLGLLTGLLVMIPYLGPILSVGPAALVAAADGGEKVLSVLVLFAILQFLESYILTPLVQEEAADLPPVLTLFAQTVMGLLFGLIGILMAAPLTAVGLVLVQDLWVARLEEGEADEESGQIKHAAEGFGCRLSQEQ